jgi:hypothetical protein
MFEKRKAKRAEKKNGDVAELLELQKTSLKQIDEEFSTIEKITDPAERILRLQGFIRSVDDASRRASCKKYNIADKRANKKAWKVAGGGALAGVAALAVPVAIFCPPALPVALLFTPHAALLSSMSGPLSKGRIMDTKRKRLLEQNPALKDFSGTVAERRELAAERLAETIQSCNLEEVSLCARFEEAFENTPSLRERFAKAAAAAAQKAQEEKVAAQQAPASAKKASLNPDRVKRLGIN